MNKREYYLVVGVQTMISEAVSFWNSNKDSILGVCFVFKKKRKAERYAKKVGAEIETLTEMKRRENEKI